MTVSGIADRTVRLLHHEKSLSLNRKVKCRIGRCKGSLRKLRCDRSHLHTKSDLRSDRLLIALRIGRLLLDILI